MWKYIIILGQLLMSLSIILIGIYRDDLHISAITFLLGFFYFQPQVILKKIENNYTYERLLYLKLFDQSHYILILKKPLIH
ncbi:hypothetical protein SAMN05421734_1033 [Pelagirhabdus alkalitolerans]|uniref:Uncharacterized protein n=1 Tax=Pelagirhabdus alkalitolerans TaxID=1612202 RepID=A0A1G6HHV2_9BACI|nr:hypothetical protein [Pelagirhabdus alkalitolerans]SDB93764.1 hypothetical protein SAMN05421734_1033 [Pelagirhabdus alkalitolerans]